MTTLRNRLYALTGAALFLLTAFVSTAMELPREHEGMFSAERNGIFSYNQVKWLPIQLGICPPAQVVSSWASVPGLALNLGVLTQHRVYGISGAFMLNGIERMYGLGLGTVNMFNYAAGISIAFIQFVRFNRSLMISLANIITDDSVISGAQVGFFNLGGWFQIGVFNGRGKCQIGLMNFCPDNHVFAWLPLFNCSWF